MTDGTHEEETDLNHAVAATVDPIVRLPSSLTARNGAKALLSGEFFEHKEVVNPAHCGVETCSGCEHIPFTIIQHTPISWGTIKDIYAKIVENFSSNITPIYRVPKDHVVAAMVNELTEAVPAYANAQSLRDVISGIVTKHLKSKEI